MRRPHPLVRVLILCVAATSLFGARPSQAQATVLGDNANPSTRSITGRVVDEQQRGIANVEVRAAVDVSTLTDSTGRFVLRGVANGPTQLVARRVGYDSASVTVAAATTGAAPDVSIVLARTRRLNEIVVEGQAYDRALWDRGFYHRQKVASGMFFDRDAITHFGGNGLSSLVQQAPRVDVRRINNQDYAFSTIAGRPCRMNVYVDGMFQRVAMPSPSGEEGVGLSELVDVRDIAAVEVYPRASAVPIAFQRMGPPAGPQGISSAQIGSPSGGSYRSPPQGENADAACGASVIWTKAPASANSTSPNS